MTQCNITWSLMTTQISATHIHKIHLPTYLHHPRVWLSASLPPSGDRRRCPAEAQWWPLAGWRGQRPGGEWARWRSPPPPADCWSTCVSDQPTNFWYERFSNQSRKIAALVLLQFLYKSHSQLFSLHESTSFRQGHWQPTRDFCQRHPPLTLHWQPTRDFCQRHPPLTLQLHWQPTRDFCQTLTTYPALTANKGFLPETLTTYPALTANKGFLPVTPTTYPAVALSARDFCQQHPSLTLQSHWQSTRDFCQWHPPFTLQLHWP